MPAFEPNDRNMPDDKEACYEIVASQEEIYLEETEELAIEILASECPPSSPDSSKTNSLMADTLQEQLTHAAEDLITGDSDDPPLSRQAVMDLLGRR